MGFSKKSLEKSLDVASEVIKSRKHGSKRLQSKRYFEEKNSNFIKSHD